MKLNENLLLNKLSKVNQTTSFKLIAYVSAGLCDILMEWVCEVSYLLESILIVNVECHWWVPPNPIFATLFLFRLFHHEAIYIMCHVLVLPFLLHKFLDLMLN